MNNEIQRKITSLTLMAIMVAGGMAVAFPGMEPANAANPNLFVSVEKTGNFAGIQVIEIVVDDPDRSSTSESKGRPNVDINGDDVFMTQADDGMWYAYVANDRAIDDFGSDIKKIYGTESTSTRDTIRSGSGSENVFINVNGFLDGYKDLVFGSFTIQADNITVDGILYTAVDGEETVEDGEFVVGNTDSATAINLAKAISDKSNTLVATANNKVVTVEAINVGAAGNDISISSNNNDSLNISGETKGGIDAITATATITVSNPTAAAKATSNVTLERISEGTTITVNDAVYTAGANFTFNGIDSQDAKSFADAVISIQSGDLQVTSSGNVVTITVKNIQKSLTVTTSETNDVAVVTTGRVTGNTVSIGPLTLIAGIDIAIVSNDDTNAIALATVINTENVKSPTTVNFTASAQKNIVTITATDNGAAGNGIVLSASDGVAFDTSGNTAGGADAMQAIATITLDDVQPETIQDREDKNGTSVDNNVGLISKHWPIIQTYDIASNSDVTITYGSGGTAQKANISYDYDDSVDITLDRDDYPTNSYVLITLDDSLLNLSPTADDLWAFDIDNGDVTYFIEDTKIHATNVDWTGIGFEEGPLGFSDRDGVLKIVDTKITSQLSENNGYVIFRESANNDNVFVNYDRTDRSGLIVVNTGRASISYNDGYSIINDAFVGVLKFDSSVNDWTSGVELAITLVDEDRNKFSRIDETMSILEDEVPYITIGNPLHLGEIYDDNGLGNANLRIESPGSKTFKMSVDNNQNEITIDFDAPYPSSAEDNYVFNYISYDFSEVGGKSGVQRLTTIDSHDEYHLTYDVDSGAVGVVYFDVLSFGQEGDLTTGNDRDGNPMGIIDDNVPRVNDAFYRFELEENAKDSAEFVGTVEYIMINQLNVFLEDTYDSIVTTGDEIIMIVNDDMDGGDEITVTYRDEDSTGTSIISSQKEANTHTGVIKLDKSSYSSGDTIEITLIDADLNTDSSIKEVYSVDHEYNWIGNDDTWLVKLLIDNTPYDGSCKDSDDARQYNLYKTGLTLIETKRSSDTFTGTLALPAFYCDDRGNLKETNGLDLDVEYQDYSDSSGSSNESSAGASLRSNTGSVSLDRTVYPVPFDDDDFVIYDGDSRNDGETLDAGDVIITISVTDADSNISASGTDKLSTSTLVLKILSGSRSAEIDIDDPWMVETTPSSGIFEVDVSIQQKEYDSVGIINKGDILHVEYTDPQDASGDKNTVTDSATFDLRNAVLQSDKPVYIIGSSAIITLIEPDLNLDSNTAETWTLDLINWDSDAGQINLSGEYDGRDLGDLFDANPSGLRETGDNTGIFQVVIEIPKAIGNDKLERGEHIQLEYQDQGPAGSDYVGDDEEDIRLDIYTSNFGATITLDQKVYTWTDKVFITVVAPDHNFDSNVIDEIGRDRDSEVTIKTRSDKLENYKLVETGPDTGIFTGEVILTGFRTHDADGDGEEGDTSGLTQPKKDGGPTNGMLAASDDDGLSVSFEYSDGDTATVSSLIRWNIGEIQWLEASYPASGSGLIRVIDPDMNLKPETVDSFDVTVWSDTVTGGIDLRVTETNEATGIFEGTVFFTTTQTSSGSRLLVAEGDTVTVKYEDNTLPNPYSTADELSVTSTTLIGTLVPPLERAPVGNLKLVDAFGNSLGAIQIDQQVQIEADIVNGQDRTQEFAYLVQVQDNGGVTVSLSWITGDLTPGQSLTSAVSWIPEHVGTYTATVFVWASVDNPTALSPPGTLEIIVR